MIVILRDCGVLQSTVRGQKSKIRLRLPTDETGPAQLPPYTSNRFRLKTHQSHEARDIEEIAMVVQTLGYLQVVSKLEVPLIYTPGYLASRECFPDLPGIFNDFKIRSLGLISQYLEFHDLAVRAPVHGCMPDVD
jgi:hypothetical protein